MCQQIDCSGESFATTVLLAGVGPLLPEEGEERGGRGEEEKMDMRRRKEEEWKGTCGP